MIHRNPERRVEELIDAAERCFESKGVAHTSMLDIAAEASVSRTSLYKYFRRIEHMFEAVFRREFERFEAKLHLKLVRCSSPEQRLLEIVLGITENVPNSSWIGSLISGPLTSTDKKALRIGRAALDERITSLIESPLKELAQKKTLRSDVKIATVVAWVRTIVHAFSTNRHPGEFTKSERRTLINNFLLYSICK
jgi:AcrR family transcriptional regulator